MNRLSRNIFYNLLGRSILLLLSLVSVKIIFKQLGADVLGIIYFTAMMNSILTSVSQMGISATIVREVAAHYKSDPNYIRNFLRTISLLYWLMYLTLGVAIYFFAPTIVENWINLKSVDQQTGIYMLRVLGIASVIALPKSLYICIFRGIQRMEFDNGIEVVTTGLQQFGIVIILSFGGRLNQVIHFYAFIYYIRILIYLVFSTKFFPIATFIPGFSIIAIKRNLNFGSKMFISSIISTIYLNADRIIISKFLPISTLGYYSVAKRMILKVNLITQAISQAAYPNLSYRYRRGNRDLLMSKYKKLQDSMCFGIVPVYAFIPFAFYPVFSYVLNAEIARTFLLPVILLCVAGFMQTTGLIPHSMNLASGNAEIPMRTNFYVLIINLPITILLTYYFGILGAAISIISSRIVAYCYGVPMTCKKSLKISTWEWYWHVLKIFILSALTYGVGGLVLFFKGEFTLINLSMVYITATVMYLMCTFFIMENKIKIDISNRFRLKKGPLKQYKQIKRSLYIL